MVYHRYIPPDAQGQFRPVFKTRLNGTVVELMGTPDGGFVIRRQLDPKIVQAVRDLNRDQAGIWRKGVMLGKTQAHVMPIGHLPVELHYSLKEKWGDPVKDPDAAKTWKKRLWNNPEARAFRASEHKI